MKRTFITIMAAAAVLASCDNAEVAGLKGKGTFMLQSVTANTDLNDVQVKPHGLPSELNQDKLLAALELTIKNSEDANLKQTYKYLDIVNKPVELSTGKYTVSAVSTDAKDAAWDQPLFAGSTDFAVVANAVSPVNLICSMTNAVVSIKCSDTFKTEVNDYNIKVSDAKGNFLTWTKDNIAEDGYFTAKELTVTIEGKRSLDNSTATVTGTIQNIQAKDHITLNIDARVTGQVQQIVVTVETKVNDKPVDIFVDGFEEIEIPDPSQPDPTPTPDPEEPEVDPNAPSLVWESNPTFEEREIQDKMDVEIVIKAPKAIKGFKVKVESPALFGILVGNVGLPENIDNENKIVTLDLIGDAKVVEQFTMFPTGDKVKGKTEVLFSLSTLVPMIKNFSPEPGSHHVFTLNLEDGAGNTLTQAVSFICPSKK
ncbi:MAG: DUF4493 domain-containing protein [Bacteroides sp.]|nr:DUF4493 domain-containing protein [Bacteroides sp.]